MASRIWFWLLATKVLSNLIFVRLTDVGSLNNETVDNRVEAGVVSPLETAMKANKHIKNGN